MKQSSTFLCCFIVRKTLYYVRSLKNTIRFLAKKKEHYYVYISLIEFLPVYMLFFLELNACVHA